MFAGYIIDTNIHAAFLLQGYEADPLTKKYLAFYNILPLPQRLVPDFIMSGVLPASQLDIPSGIRYTSSSS